NLYDAATAGYGPADVVLTGPSGPVRGSLLINAGNSSFTFIKTGVGTTGLFAGVLPAGAYTVTFRSATDGFVEPGGALLDGNGDGVAGDDYVTTFVVAAPSGVFVSVADFARGPDAASVINVPNTTTNGIPITLNNGSGVTSGQFVLHYDPTLLTISGGTVNPTLSGATFSVTVSPAGTATINFTSPTPLSAGSVRLGGLTAVVPNTAPYRAKELLHFTSVQLNGGAIAAVGDDGVHVVAYFGDAFSDGALSPLDSSLISRVATVLDSGFAAYRLADPTIIADVNNGGFVDSGDVTLMNRKVAGMTVTQIPTIPVGVTLTPTGPDPTLSLPTDLQAAPGEAVMVPVNIDTARPEDSGGMMEAVLALRFDPQVFTVSAADVHLGTLPASGSGWQLSAAVNAQTGEIGIDLYSLHPIVSRTGGSLVTITLHVRDDAPTGMTALNLVPSVNPTGQREYRTEAADALGTFVLHPAVTLSGADAGVDGRVTVPAPMPSSALDTQPLTQAISVAQAAPAPAVALPTTFDVFSAEGKERWLAPTMAEQVFADLERTEHLATVKIFDEYAPHEIAEVGDAAAASAHDLGLALVAEGKPETDWVPNEYLRHLGRVARRGGKPRSGSLLDDMTSGLEGADQAAVEAFFASEAAKSGK
ncbi:MAG TPA: cohesin domain-containing protein, partial [Gemmataceae bacterium]|nr:cohesin domain-containing protein [Gemmataceae bacterium]